MLAKTLLLLGCSTVLILVLGQLVVREKSCANVILIALLLAFTVWSYQGTIYILGLSAAVPHLTKIHIPFISLSGALFYLYNQSLFNDYRLSKKTWVHMVPGIICALLILPFYMQSAEFKLNYAENNVYNTVTTMVYAASRLSEISAISYLGLNLWFLRNVKWQSAEKDIGRGAVRVMAVITIVTLLALLSRSVGSILNAPLFSVMVPCLMIFAALIGFYMQGNRSPRFVALDFVPYRPRQKKKCNHELLENYTRRIEREQLFLDPDITLPKLATKLRVQAHVLSALINDTANTNFKSFINSFRVEYAKQLLANQRQMPILDVAYACGFNSKSVFYSHFSQATQLTPAQYRKNSPD